MDRHHEVSQLNLGEELFELPPLSPGAISTTSCQFDAQATSVGRQQPESKSPTTVGTASFIEFVNRDSDDHKSRSDTNNKKYQNDGAETAGLRSQGRVSRKRRKVRQGCKYGLARATIAACATLLVNALTTVMIAICLHDKRDNGVVPLYTGSKSAVNARATGVNLLINALSALLLSGANYSMQCLASPTRSELDGAHRRRKRLDIGMSSARNPFGGISWKRSVVWMILLLSSLPVHTFYNGVIFSTLNDNEYDIWVVNEGFLSPNVTADELQSWALQAQTFETPWSNDTEDCAREVQHVHAAFALSTSDSPEQIQRHELPACDHAYSDSDDVIFSERSTLVLVSSEKGPYGNRSLLGYANYRDFLGWTGFDDGHFGGYRIDYCLSQITKRSTLQLSFQLASLVIACNLIIALAMLWLLYSSKTEPLVTVGDALTSFLDDPQGEFLNENSLTPTMRSANRLTRSNHMVISRIRWVLGLSVNSFCFLMAGAFAGFCLWMEEASAFSFGVEDMAARTVGAYLQYVTSIFQGGGPPRLLGSVLMANVPQLLCSLFYLVYNGLLSLLLLAREWNSFYLRKRIVRVSDPKGQQRSTYYLQRRFTLVYLTKRLHHSITSWNSSGGKIDTYPDSDAVTTSTTGFPQICVSKFGLLLAAILTLLMIIALIWFGSTKLSGGMPIVGSNSQLIAAACHRPDDDEDAAYLPVSRGELVDDSGKGPGHCCFTSKDVQAPAWIREHDNVPESERESEGWMSRKCRSVCDKLSDLMDKAPGLRSLVRGRAQKRELEQQAVWLYAGT